MGNRPEEAITEFREPLGNPSLWELIRATELNAKQLGRLFGVGPRTVQGWIAGFRMSSCHQARLGEVSEVILPLGETVEERRKALFGRGEDEQLFSKLVREAPRSQVINPEPYSVMELHE